MILHYNGERKPLDGPNSLNLRCLDSGMLDLVKIAVSFLSLAVPGLRYLF